MLFKLKLQMKMKKYCEKHRIKWINREATKIFRENNEKFKHKLRPPWQNDVSDRMQEKVIRQSISAQERRQKLLNDDIKHINKLSVYKQIIISEDFEKNKTQWVKEARNSGTENPEQEVCSRYRQRINNIKSKQEHAIKQAHERHGIDYNPQNLLTQKFNHEM